MGSPLLSLSVLTPEKKFFLGEVAQIVFSTPEGRLGVMRGHAQVIASVEEGVMEIFVGGERKTAAVGPGFGEIAYERAEFFVDTAEWADEIDAIRAKEALERAEHRMKSNLSRMEYIRTQAAISRAMTRLKAAEYSRSRGK